MLAELGLDDLPVYLHVSENLVVTRIYRLDQLVDIFVRLLHGHGEEIFEGVRCLRCSTGLGSGGLLLVVDLEVDLFFGAEGLVLLA